MWKQEVDNLKEQLETEKLEKVSMKAEIDELKVLVQQLINETPGLTISCFYLAQHTALITKGDNHVSLFDIDEEH